MTGRPSILIADDEPANVEILAALFEDDYDVLVATAGAQTLEVATKQRPDLVLLDIVLPDIDGYAVCTALKGDPLTSDIPVIFVTARDDVSAETRGLELGAVDYVTKPITPAVVRMRVRNHIELKRSRDMLARLAHIDGLTGLANRRRFDEQLDLELRRLRRLNEPLSLVMMDVDHFKKFNDAYGHQAGDDCLRQVATALATALHRPADLAARYGGEEFAAILPGTDAEGAVRVAEAIRAGVAALGIPHAASSTAAHVTVSLGIATAYPAAGISGREIIELADSQLYRAKTEGRNRVAAAAPVQAGAASA